jgi:threonine/homoserine/homoserine lactone efflux protein
MIDLGSIWLFAVPFALAAAIPGPALAALVGQVLARGPRASVRFVAGMLCGNMTWLLTAIFGLSALAVRFETAFLAIKWLGIVYLVFVAYKLWTAAAAVPPQVGAVAAAGRSSFLGGLAVTLANPKAVVFFGAILPHAFDLAALTALGVVEIAAIGLAIDLCVQSTYVGLAGWTRRALTSAHSLRIANRSAAAVMAGSAGLIAVRS